jgi:hypothetical protein
MTIKSLVHDKTHEHYLLGKKGVGTFKVCKPLMLLGRSTVEFQPDEAAEQDRWYGVPAVEYGEKDTLFIRMIHADDAAHAMALLRLAYEEDRHD